MKYNKLKVGVAVSYLAAGISVIVSLIYTPFMLRMLGKSEYGTYQLIYAVAGYLSLLSFGFGSAYIKFYSAYIDENREKSIAKLNGMFLTVFSVLAVVCCIVGFILVFNMGGFFKKLTAQEAHTAQILLSFLVVNVALTFLNSVFDSYIIAHEDFLFQKVTYLIKTVLNPILTVPFLLLGFKSVVLVVITTLLTAISLLINYVYCVKKLKMRFSFTGFDTSLLKKIAVFSSFIFLNIVTDQINWNLDRFLLGVYRSSAEIAVYGVAAQLNTYYMSCSSIVSSVFIPRVNRIAVQKDADKGLNDIFIKVGRIQFMILALICSGFIFFGKTFIRLWAGSGYEQAFPIALILLSAVTVPMIQNIGIEIQKAKNLHKFRSIIYAAIAVCNLILSIILTPKYGIWGCTVGTAASLIVGNIIIMNVYYHRTIKLNVLRFWRSIAGILPSIAIPVLFGEVYNKFIGTQSKMDFVLGVMAYAVVYGISIYLLGMNSYERNLARKPITTFVRRFIKR